MSRRIALWAAILLVAGISGAALYFYLGRAVPPPLAPVQWNAVVSTVAGTGEPRAVDGPPDRASFAEPFALAIDRGHRIFVADAGESNRIRRIETDGRVVTLAGGAGEGWRDGFRGAAMFHTPSGIAVDSEGTVYVADTGSHRIRRITRDGAVTTIAGGSRGFADGEGASARFDGPMGLALAPDGTLYIADAYNDRIRAIGRDGVVRTVAGNGIPGFADGAPTDAQFDTPCGVAVAPDGSVLVADAGNNTIRRISRGMVATITVHPLAGFGTELAIVRPVGIAASRAGIFVTDARGRIVQVFEDGNTRVLAGRSAGFADGDADAARFDAPSGLAIDGTGALLVADAGNALIRRIAPIGRRAFERTAPPVIGTPGFHTDNLRFRVVPWPVGPQFEWHEVAGTMGEARGGIPDTRERFHAGVDVHAPDGVPVLAIESAKVSAPISTFGFGTLNESVAIGSFTYVHLRVGRTRRNEVLPGGDDLFTLVPDATGRPSRVRLRRGTRINLSDPIGTVNQFSHVHLNAGPSGREINPLLLPLPGFVDTIPPVIEHRGISFFDEAWMPLETRVKGRLQFHGRVRIVVDAYDRVNGNVPRRRLGIYRLGYQVLHPDGTPAPGYETPRTTIVFDRLPHEAGAPQTVYAEGSGITVYGARRTRFRYIVTNRLQDGHASEDVWDTTTLEPGPYVVRVIVADAAGNEAVAGRDVPVQISRQ